MRVINNKTDRRHALLTVFSVMLGGFVLSVLGCYTAVGQTNKLRLVRPRIQRATVEITNMGYEPGSLQLKRGVPAQITFLRKTDQTCATEVVFPDQGIYRDLPLNKLVVVSFTPKKAGEFKFTCGMNMHRGKLIVR